MEKNLRTTGEHIVALYGHITGVKKDDVRIQNIAVHSMKIRRSS
jgi:hypothetical protein